MEPCANAGAAAACPPARRVPTSPSLVAMSAASHTARHYRRHVARWHTVGMRTALQSPCVRLVRLVVMLVRVRVRLKFGRILKYSK